MTPKLILHPESRTSTIQPPEGAIKELVSRRAASQKCYAMPNGRRVVYCWNKHAPVHYRDDYGNDKESWKEIDPTHYEDRGDHLLFDRMPHTVKVWKDRHGYEITDRRTGKVMSAELLEIDDEPVGQSAEKGAVSFEAEIKHNGVRFWKETKAGGPKKFKWRIRESAGESVLRFRNVPEAFDQQHGPVTVAVTKDLTPDGFIWTETVDRVGVKIDTDFEGQTSDGYINGYHGIYSTARGTSASCDATQTTLTVGQRYNATKYYIYRSFLDFNTSAVSGAINQVNLKLTTQYLANDTEFDVQIVKQTWAEALCSNAEANYDGCLAGTLDDNIWRSTSGIAGETQYTSGNLDTTYINTSGDTKYSLRSSRDANGDTPTGNEFIRVDSADSTVESRPVLVVDYTPSGITTDIWGVPAATIAKVNGVAVASIAKINGVTAT